MSGLKILDEKPFSPYQLLTSAIYKALNEFVFM
jgi:hypothetical protein